MGVSVVKGVPDLAKRLKAADMEGTMRRVSKILVSGAIRKINGNVPPENAPLTKAVKQGDRTLRDSGRLMSSISAHSGKDWAAAGTNLKYAKIMQTGGTITGKGKGLWIPAGAETRTLMRKHNAQKPSELIKAMRDGGWSFYRAGNVFLAKSKRGKPFPLFIIKKSVTITARPFLHIDEADEKAVKKEIRKTIRNALGGKK